MFVRGTEASGPPPLLGDGSVSALAAQRTSSDSLPASVADTSAAQWIASAGASRRVYADSARIIWLVPGTSDSICHVDQTDGAGLAVGCAPRSLLRTGMIYSTSRESDGTTSILGVVDDNVQSISAGGREILVHHNVFVLGGVTSDSLTLKLRTASVDAPFTIDHLYPAADDPAVVGHPPSR